MGKGQSKIELNEKRKGTVGRPRVYDPQKIMEEMLAWSNRDDSINFAGFCAERGYLPNLIWRLEQESKEFEEAYTLVRMKLAERRERYLNADLLNYGTFQRYQKGYDPFLSRYEDMEANMEAERRKGVAKSEQMTLVMLAKLSAEGKFTQPD